MPPINPSAEDWRTAFWGLLPQGRVWPRDPDTVQAQVILALMQAFVRHTTAANGLLVDAFPATTDDLLPEWQATLGLPDPCAGNATLTLAQEQAQVVARLVSRGGQSRPYFLNLAQTLGWTDAQIVEYPPYRCGMSGCNDPLCDQNWAFAFRMLAASTSEPDQILVCEVRNRAPAHCWAMFTFDTAGNLAADASIENIDAGTSY